MYCSFTLRTDWNAKQRTIICAVLLRRTFGNSTTGGYWMTPRNKSKVFTVYAHSPVNKWSRESYSIYRFFRACMNNWMQHTLYEQNKANFWWVLGGARILDWFSRNREKQSKLPKVATHFNWHTFRKGCIKNAHRQTKIKQLSGKANLSFISFPIGIWLLFYSFHFLCSSKYKIFVLWWACQVVFKHCEELWPTLKHGKSS